MSKIMQVVAAMLISMSGVAEAGVIRVGGMDAGSNGFMSSRVGVCTVSFNAGNQRVFKLDPGDGTYLGSIYGPVQTWGITYFNEALWMAGSFLLLFILLVLLRTETEIDRRRLEIADHSA